MKYLIIIYTYLKKRAVYKFDIVMGYLLSVVIAFTSKYFWQSLVVSGKIPQNELLYYISYSTLTAVMGILFGGELINTFSDKVRSGSLISDLQKPLSFQLYNMASSFGTILGNIIFDMFPKYIALTLVIGIYIPRSPSNILLFIISLLLGCMIMVAIDFILSVFAIYFVDVMPLIILKGVAIGLLAGSIIPLWIFPQKLLSVIDLLPFRLICFLPISIYLEKVSGIAAVSSLAFQLLWLLGLVIIGKTISSVLLKEITVAGG